MMFGLFGSNERRSLENPANSIADARNWSVGSYTSSSSVSVNETSALGVPALWQAVNLISSTIANLPLHLYKINEDGEAEKATADPLYRLVHDRANDVHSKSQFFKLLIWRALASDQGRGLALITRNVARRVAGFIPLDERTVRITQEPVNGRLVRTYIVNGKEYKAADIIDIAPILDYDGRGALSPIMMNKAAVGAMIAAEKYATELFANGGVPPLALKPSVSGSPVANDRAASQISEFLKLSRDRKRHILPMPVGFDLEKIGFDPQAQQLIELRRFHISEAARIYNIAPALLFDLSTGTYSNVEQQSLSFSTQTILPLVKLIEQELNMKLFGDRNVTNYVEFNVDGMVRGDLKSRMEALARGVNASLITPNEGRALDNRPALAGGDKLYIQGATVPLEDAGKERPSVPAPKDAPDAITDDTNEEDKDKEDNDNDEA
jgi:HK97 family phage portal protein